MVTSVFYPGNIFFEKIKIFVGDYYQGKAKIISNKIQ